MSPPLFRSPVAVLDSETTGFPSDRRTSVIDVGGIILDVDGQEIASFSTLVRPLAWGPWCDGATAIHGIGWEQVADAPKPADVARDLAEWLTVNGARYVTAYNVDFDCPMLARMGADSLQWAPCVMERAMDLMGPAGALRDSDPGHPRYNPGRPWLFPPLCPKVGSGASACEFFGVDPVLPAHRALADATTAARVLVAMRRRQ